MIGKNNKYLKKTKEGTKVESYSIKKFKVGAASVVIGASIFFGAGAVAQASEDVSKNTTTDNSKDEGATLGGAVSEKVVAKPVVKEATKDEVAAGVAAKLGVKETAKETEKEITKEPVTTLDKTQLSSFISEVEGKISNGAYANKTEESVASLVADLNAAKATLDGATTQEELTRAYQKLVVSVNSKLRNKPVEKKETPVVDSTTLKGTVDNKAENTEKKVESNSVEKTGAKDPRTGKEIAKNTAFRAAVNQDPKVDFTFSIPDEKKIYIYNEEHFSLEIPVYSETGKIRYATIKKGSRQRFPNVAGTDNDLDVEFGFTATVINRAETPGVTSDASQANPAKIVITGRPNDILKKHRDYTKQETQTLNIGTRYVQVVDDQGRENLKKGMDITDPGYFYLVLKAQSKKYALRSQPTDEKISVSSLTNPTAEDLQKIKDSIQLEYSTTNEDARFADKRGTLVEHPEDVIQSVNIVGNNIVVTFTDGSTKTKPVGEIVQKNIPPVVNLPYSNEANRNIYIYSGEETDLTFTATDESKIKDLKLRGPGDINYNNATNYGLAVGNIVDSAVTSGEGSVSEDKKTATIKMTGTTSLTAGKKWTSVIVAKDDNNGESAPFNGRINATTNPTERQKIAGYVEFVVKNQTSKYDIKAPEGKVSVVDPTNVTAEEFEKIKEKVKIEYSQTNDDANFTSKRGQVVDNQATRISTITKDNNGNLVVTYKDGSTDTKPLSEFTSLNKQPAIDAVNKAAQDKIAEINSNTNVTAEEKAAAIEKVNADKTKALTAINDNSVTTKAALDNAKTSGTTAISNDNPVATKKDTAKAAIDTALREKEAAIDANNALTTEEKNAAKADAQAKATAAKTAIDNATTNAAVDSAKTAGTTSVSSVTPTATAKPAAKNAIDEALKAKEAQLDARADLTDEEKKAAKAEAQAKATAAKAAIDNATTNATVDSAKTPGVAEVESVNPQASQKKTDAKNAVDEALKAKEAAIDANNDLTDEEKAKAKQEAQAKADAAEEAINNARTNAEVETAKTNGTTEVNNVNPQPEAKTAAKKAVEDELAEKIKAIEGNNDLTDEEKAKAKQDAQAKATEAKNNIDAARTNAEVETAKTNGTTEVKAVDPQPEAKTEAKKAIDDVLKVKNDEIDARTDLTDEEKTVAKVEAKAKADAAKEAIDKATTNAEVDQAKANGTTEVTSVDPQSIAKSEAKKAIDDKLAEQLKVIANTPEATDEEKKAAADKAKQLAEEAKKAIDAAKTNADVKKLQDDSEAKIEKAVPLVEDKPNARKVIDEEAKAKKAAIDARTDISDKVKELLKAEVDEIATQAKKVIDAASSVDEINKIEEVKKSEIKAVEEVRVPAEKVIVADPTNLTDEEKAKVLAAIKSVNPDAKEITQDAKGNVIVITANGHKQVISVAQVTKTEADLAKENAGNVVNTPVAKTAVADVIKLTEAEKQEVIAKVKAVNPGATVAIDEKGNVIVTNGEGLVFVLPVLDLVIPADKLTDITANSKVNTPAIRTLVANKGSLTPEEIAKIKATIEEINPGAIVVVDAKGNATVTTKDGKSATISSEVLVKDAADVAVKNNGENINLDFDKEVVTDINNLTESDKEKVKFKVLGAIREAVELVVDAKGNVTVILKDGRTFTILAKDIFEQRKEVTVNLPERVKVKDASNLTETEKEAVKHALITANPNLKDATISNTGEATIVYPDGQVVVISAKNLVVAEITTGVIVEDNAGNYTKEDKKPAVDYSNDNTPKFNAKKGQRLANTGMTETNTGLAGLGMALLSGLLAVAKRRKEKEE